MTNFRTALIAGLLTFAGTSVFAADDNQATAPEMNTTASSATSFAKVMPVKASVLVAKRETTHRVARIIHRATDIQVVSKANVSANTKFIFSSPKNTNTKMFMPSAPKNAAMPNLFKK